MNETVIVRLLPFVLGFAIFFVGFAGFLLKKEMSQMILSFCLMVGGVHILFALLAVFCAPTSMTISHGLIVLTVLQSMVPVAFAIGTRIYFKRGRSDLNGVGELKG